MNPDAVAVAAADWLAGRGLFWRAAFVAEHQLIGGQANGLADRIGREAFGQRFGDRAGGLLGRGLEDGLAHLLHPSIVRGASARLATEQSMLIEQFAQDRAATAKLLRILFVLHAVMD